LGRGNFSTTKYIPKKFFTKQFIRKITDKTPSQNPKMTDSLLGYSV
jgi:hypothetical protein